MNITSGRTACAVLAALMIVSLAQRVCVGEDSPAYKVARLPATQTGHLLQRFAPQNSEVELQSCDDDCDTSGCEICQSCACADCECAHACQDVIQIPVYPASVQVGTISHTWQQEPIERCQALDEDTSRPSVIPLGWHQ